ncbi:MAG: protease modulator HflK N-terminal domain-containing protein, partial [Pseudomonadota bacterium]
MPWSDNSGNGGSGGRGPTKGPWGQPPNGNGSGGRGGGEPPDLEELLQASRQRLKRAFPGGRGGGGRGGSRGPELNAQTGGLIAACMTDIPGSSAMVERGYVAYANEAKTEMLGVPAAL